MAKYTGPSCRLCRREGAKLYLKGDRCNNMKADGSTKATCPFDRAGSKGVAAPGPAHNGRKKTSEYANQLREKQKTKRIYGLLEKQFYSYYEKAEKMKGVTGENMLILIERRLDNVVFRMGIAVSRAQARQMICHGHVTVNGKKVDIPSYLVSEGEEIAIKPEKLEKAYVAAIKDTKVVNPLKPWLSFDREALKGSILAMPTRADIDEQIEEHKIVELYSK